jgi:GT2 family glycosyltransferase
MDKVSVIIPYFRCLPYLRECLAALLTHTAYPLHDIVIVNDGSPDSRALQTWWRRQAAASRVPLRLVQRADNRGFAYTCNEGATHAGGDWLVFLNADTQPCPGWLEALMHFARSHDDCGVAGARLLYPGNGLVQHAGGAFDADLEPFHLYQGEPAHLPFLARNRVCQWLTGACMLARKADFAALGGFDTAYGSAAEDLDFCFHVRHTLGKQVYLVGHSVLFHVSNVTGVTAANYNDKKRLFRHQWQERIVADDAAHYEADGFSRPMLAALDQLGIAREFWKISLFLEDLGLTTAAHQQLYLERKGLTGLGRDWQERLGAVTIDHTGPGLAPAIRPRTADKILINRLFQQLHAGADPRPEVFANLLQRLDAAHVFFYCYSLASLYLQRGEAEQARLLFTFLSEAMPGFNDELAGKACFKLAQLNSVPAEKAHWLKRCLALYPAHRLAREQVENVTANTTEKT